MQITDLLAFSVKNKASDLHLSAGLPPMIRVHGDVRRLNVDPLEHKQVFAMLYDIMNDTQRKVYEENLEVDFSFEIEGLARQFSNVELIRAAAVLSPRPIRSLDAEGIVLDFHPDGSRTMVATCRVVERSKWGVITNLVTRPDLRRRGAGRAP